MRKDNHDQPPGPEYLLITPDFSAHPAFINRYETVLRDTASTLRGRLGQVRVLYHLGRPPPDVTLACLFPCSARPIAPHLFVSDATLQPYRLSFQRAWTVAIPVVAEAAHFGLLVVERPRPLTPDEQQDLKQAALQMACHLLKQLIEVENNAETSAGLIIDKRGQRVLLHRQLIGLRGKQLALFQVLYQHRGYLCSRHFLGRCLYGADGVEYQKALTLLVHHLRRKLARHPQNPLWIENVRNRGYCLRILTKFL